MPRIFDNIEQQLLSALCETLDLSFRADFCVGYFNLRGWRRVGAHIEPFEGGDGNCCRLLVGMQGLDEEVLRQELDPTFSVKPMDLQTASRLKRRSAEHFKEQLTIGIPSDEDELGLRRLSVQLRAKKLFVKLFLKRLHAKLYLMFRKDSINPIIGYLGSSNLTLGGLSKQGELNIDVLDSDASSKLAKWFEDLWADRWSVDISEELAEIIDRSWAREDFIPPYHIYVKMAYHLAEEARAGLSEFRIPREFKGKLADFQTAAVKIAAHHLNKRDGVLIGDVVGLGKTIMATAIARIFEDDYGLQTLIICPKNLVEMWEDYCHDFHLRGKVISITQAPNRLPELRRYRLIIIDESHNLRNRDGKRYRAIREYIQDNESKCILLTATPYNKTYLDLSNQLRLFVSDDEDLGIRPEQYLRTMSELEFARRHQCSPRSLAAFEQSEHPDDWRELMRLYLVRRTRSFIKQNYAIEDSDTGREYLPIGDEGVRFYFPIRDPKRIQFQIDESDVGDQYAKLYHQDVVDSINELNLPRYGMANYLADVPSETLTSEEVSVISDLSRAGKRLMGFCRTNLFKRLESSGHSFIQSVERHILRNFVYISAIEQERPIPLGTQESEMLDTRFTDQDAEALVGLTEEAYYDNEEVIGSYSRLYSREDFLMRADELYVEYETSYERRFKWLRSSLFTPRLAEDLEKDCRILLDILDRAREWNPDSDSKLKALHRLLTEDHPKEKVIVFSQFADTVKYLSDQLSRMGVKRIEAVTGDTESPTRIAWRFSPESNKKKDIIPKEEELRVLLSTDVLSEGQNLQDCSIVVNYDLPWAIIRLVQRVGRVDRIGQTADNIRCYSFWPAEGVERIIRLRDRVRQRLRENAEVVGTDEAFFEDDRSDNAVLDLYHEKADVLDIEDDAEVDLASYAYEIWKKALDEDSSIEKIIEEIPHVCYSTRKHQPTEQNPEGVLVYLRTAQGNNALAWIDKNGRNVTESQFAILKAAKCKPETPAVPRLGIHHELVEKGVKSIVKEEQRIGGQLGRPSGARFRTYERLKSYLEKVQGTLKDSAILRKSLESTYMHPLQQNAIDTLNRQLRSGISDDDLADLVVMLYDDDRLSISEKEKRIVSAQIICSLGLKST